MTRIKLKNLPRLRLSDLLRRRKMTLQGLLAGLGIATYPGLVRHCDQMGVLPPSENEFLAAFPNWVSSPQEGIVIVGPMPAHYASEITGSKIDPVVTGSVTVTDDTDVVPALDLLGGPQKRSRRKKETTTTE